MPCKYQSTALLQARGTVGFGKEVPPKHLDIDPPNYGDGGDSQSEASQAVRSRHSLSMAKHSLSTPERIFKH